MRSHQRSHHVTHQLQTRFEHIKGLKDLRDLHATPNPGFDRSLGAAAEKQRSAFVCPVSGLDASGFIQAGCLFCFFGCCRR
jgi:hypothetical protein